MAKDKDIQNLNQEALGEPADSSRAVIEETAPPAASTEHKPADVGETEHGDGTEGPANYYSEEAEKAQAADVAKEPEGQAEAATPEAGEAYPAEPPAEKPSALKAYLWPIATLVVICLVVSALLGVTNGITEPIIAQNTAAAAEASRTALLPEATGFEDVTPAAEELPDGVTAVWRATNDVGYVVEATASGYGGQVPAMVAFGPDGKIKGVSFLENNETPGLGQKIVSDERFAAQFAGMDASPISLGSIDKIASATVSSGAAVSAVNAAIEYFAGAGASDDEIRAGLLPGAGEITPIAVEAEGVLEAYRGDDGGYIIYGVGKGIYGGDVIAAVAMDENGTILGVWLDTSSQTAGYGKELGSDESFVNSFVGATNAYEVDNVVGSTLTVDGVKDAVQYALDALAQAKEAA